MKRKPLSGNLRIEKIGIFILLALVITFSVKHYPQLLFIAIPVFLVADYLIYYYPDSVEFDENSVYIKRRGREIAVALKDIQQVKMTGVSLGYRSIWKIKYSNYYGSGSARFYPIYFSSGFEDFNRLVKEKNRNVVM